MIADFPTSANPLAVAVLMFFTVERLVELVIARRNTAQLMARGAVEIAPGHYPLMVAMHAAWLVGLWFLAIDRAPSMVCLFGLAVLQAGRFWVIATLADRWTTRIIVLPGAPLIATGPFRYFTHPNYMIVVAEIALLPLAFGLVAYAIIFSALNAAILAIRIGAESKALGIS